MTVAPLELLFEQAGLPGFDLPAELARLYAGGLGFDGPRLYANFVQTLDGVVAIPELERSNALVAGESEADRFVMGLLRALADVVVVGAGTLLAAPQGTWRPEKVYPPAAEPFAELRRARGLPERPAVAIVTTGGSLDPTHPILADGAIVLTIESAAAALRASLPAAAEVVAVNAGDRVDLPAAVALLRERGQALVLCEGGPTLFGLMLAEGLVDELFLTLSPVVAGRLGLGRLGLVEGVELLPTLQLEPRLLSVRRHGGHLFLRYAL
ncbi:MAG: dihydrofolate reductase family protein [Gaiellaceae bacterium]